jgi:mono/diheme cytochrome c family protein
MKTISIIVWIQLMAMLSYGAALADTNLERLIERGKNVYLIYCSNCHGQDARGNGPMAQHLNIPPSDLTEIKREGITSFSYEEVYKTIDGRKAVKGHGIKEMPIWGDAFAGRRAILINELVNYLESIQKNP